MCTKLRQTHATWHVFTFRYIVCLFQSCFPSVLLSLHYVKSYLPSWFVFVQTICVFFGSVAIVLQVVVDLTSVGGAPEKKVMTLMAQRKVGA